MASSKLVGLCISDVCDCLINDCRKIIVKKRGLC
jgi:hypothetical protein